VTLQGRIDSLLAKERAARIAETVNGVRFVVNRILVLPSTRRSDDERENDVRKALIEDLVADASEVGVRVDHGKVFLFGTVDSWQEYRSTVFRDEL
jgi:osmotically-inducible protein OsmY